MKTRPRTASIALAMLLALAVNACSQQPSPPASSAPATSPEAATTTAPSSESTLDSTPQSATVSGASAWAVVQSKCTVCHTLERVTQARKDWKGWNAAVDHMADNGAKLTPDERKAVVSYLAERK